MSEPNTQVHPWLPAVERLLAPIHPQHPAGGDGRVPLDYSKNPPVAVASLPTTDALEERSLPVYRVVQDEETKRTEIVWPEWKELRSMAEQLLSRSSKHLRAGLIWAVGATELDGWVGLARGLHLVAGLLDRYWVDLQPPLDGRDPWERVSILEELALEPNKTGDPYNLVLKVGRLPILCSDPKAHAESPFDPTSFRCSRPGYLGFLEIQAVLEPAKSLHAEEPELPEAAVIETARARLSQEDQTSVVAAMDGALTALDRIDALFAEHAPGSRKPNLERLANLVRRAKEWTAACKSAEVSPVAEVPGSGLEVTGGVNASAGGPWTSREQVLRALSGVEVFFRREDPGCPAGPILNLAINLAHAPFHEVLFRLAPCQLKVLTAALPGSPDGPAPASVVVEDDWKSKLGLRRRKALETLRQVAECLDFMEPGSPVAILVQLAERAARAGYAGILAAMSSKESEDAWKEFERLFTPQKSAGTKSTSAGTQSPKT